MSVVSVVANPIQLICFLFRFPQAFGRIATTKTTDIGYVEMFPLFCIYKYIYEPPNKCTCIFDVTSNFSSIFNGHFIIMCQATASDQLHLMIET